MDLRTLRIRVVSLVILAGSAAGNVHDTERTRGRPGGSRCRAHRLEWTGRQRGWDRAQPGRVFVVLAVRSLHCRRQGLHCRHCHSPGGVSFGNEKGILTPDDP